jgi:AraC family transcriptional regulator, regulatory protein of adaptative response / methylated-DNA-[protein]-cysteine methyltransferase
MTKVSTIEELASSMLDGLRWGSLIGRDTSADGKFYYSVKTTGVYCRPSWAAHFARPKSVQFHLTREDAEKAGLRPCKLCKLMQAAIAEQTAKMIAKACRLIESSEDAPSLRKIAGYVGMSIFTFAGHLSPLAGLRRRHMPQHIAANA